MVRGQNHRPLGSVWRVHRGLGVQLGLCSGHICIVTLGYVYGNPTNSLVPLYFDIRVKGRVRIRVRVRVRVRVTSPLRSILRVHRGSRVQVGLCYGYIYHNICH